MRKAADEIERFREVVQVEPEANLMLIESEGANAHLYDGDYALRTCALRALRIRLDAWIRCNGVAS